MIDPEFANQMYDWSMKEWGQPIALAVFDKRTLVPLEQLGEFVQRESGKAVPESVLRTYVDERLIPVLPGAGPDRDQLGFPLYAPSRIGLFVDLQDQGYSLAELKKIAEFEESMIDCVFTVDDLAYEDDDVQLLLAHAQEQVENCSCRLRQLTDPERPLPSDNRAADTAEAEERLASARAAIEALNSIVPERLTDARRDKIARAAFQVRMLNEVIRNTSLESDRAKVRAGYSPWVLFQSESTSWVDGKPIHTFGRIMWDATVRDGFVLDEKDGAGVRLPGLHLVGTRVTLTDGVSPTDYEHRWREYDLEGYFQARAKLLAKRACLHCSRALPDGADQRKRYCNERCRQSAKQKRFRNRHPEKVIAINERYWSS